MGTPIKTQQIFENYLKRGTDRLFLPNFLDSLFTSI